MTQTLLRMENNKKEFDIWKKNDYHGIKESLESLDSYFEDIEANLIEFLGAKSVRKRTVPSVKARNLFLSASVTIKKLRQKINYQRQDFSSDYS